jgi:hypothetical protein
MKRLLFHLAFLDCWEASWRAAGHDRGTAARYLERATELLFQRARSRDARDGWRPVLGTTHRT